MIESKTGNFIKGDYIQYQDSLNLVLLNKSKNYGDCWYKANMCYFTIKNIDEMVDGVRTNFTLEDSNKSQFVVPLFYERHACPGKTLLAPAFIIRSTFNPGLSFLYLSVGYEASYLKPGVSLPKNNYLVNQKVKKPDILIGERFGAIVGDDTDLPDEFLQKYNLTRKSKPLIISDKPMPEELMDFINTRESFEYDAKYDFDYEPSSKVNKSKKVQSLESRASKVYVMDRHLKSVLFKTNVPVVENKVKYFGEDAIQFRKLLENKLYELAEERGYSKEQVCFARKQRGGKIIVESDDGNLVQYKAIFGEMSLKTHLYINDIRRVQDGELIINNLDSDDENKYIVYTGGLYND